MKLDPIGKARLQLGLASMLMLAGLAGTTGWSHQALAEAETGAVPTYTMSPVGWIRKTAGKTFIVIDQRYQPALLGVDQLSSLWVLYWFDRNDSPAERAILQVHPRGDPERPLRGVFATRSPFRPNLIAVSNVNVLSVRDNIIEIDAIDAFADTPVLDLKP
ncbi:MAG: tRNA (N6-threonylcarbamoyladenosine(37)-N6)-methyltransferase TrmO [Rhodocyclaceae bacterium]|nr:tRNA (N6-threonylcarbamoyladenosine(37)-N6)-methyltransferase TrmO [Rhodocyclaceae bacterium]